MRDRTYFIDLIAKHQQRSEVLRSLDPDLIKHATDARDALVVFFEEVNEGEFDYTLSTARKILRTSYSLEHFINEFNEIATNASAYSKITSASEIMQNSRESIIYNNLYMSDLDNLKDAKSNLNEVLDCKILPHWHDLAAEERANQKTPKKSGRPRKSEKTTESA
tara:strand:- start:37 stop:531 length:495 start_codon:yes stop_codon:yes gene_type:complete